jgi:hypothetical protein
MDGVTTSGVMANMRREQARTGFDQPDWSAVMSKDAMLGAALLAAAFVTPASAPRLSGTISA